MFLLAVAGFLGGMVIFGYSAWRFAAALPSKPSSPLSEATVEVPQVIASESKTDTLRQVEEKPSLEEKGTPSKVEEPQVEQPKNAKEIAEPKSGTESYNRKTTSLRPPVTIDPTLLYPQRPEIGEMIGTLTIPSIKASLPIIHGTDEEELDKGVGHYANSVLPGEPDHSILSGHRDTVFRKLGEVRLNDLIIIQTSAGQFTYEVVETKVVDKEDTTVITPTSNATLSLTTCFPFRYIGNAPQRYVIRTVLVAYDLK